MDLDPGWRPDPTRAHLERWWDGMEWTNRVRNGDEETVSDFDTAMATEVDGEPDPLTLWERRSVRALVAVVVAAGLAWVITGPVWEALNGLPVTASRGAADEFGLEATTVDIAEAATNGRWDVVAAFYPETGADRLDVARTLGDCFGEPILGATVTAGFQSDSDQADGITSAAVVVQPLTPLPDPLVESLALRLHLAHDGQRWILLDPVEYAVNGSATYESCAGYDGS